MTGVDELQGHWRRAWIKAPGFEDHGTAVHWLQCGDIYADLRIPAHLPDLSGAKAVSDLPPEILLRLMESEGFAGTIDVVDSVCTWTRAINWHGTPEGVDAGRMWFKDTDHLIEDGVYKDYRELWHREADLPHEAKVFGMGAQKGYLVSSDTCFLFAIGNPRAPASDALLAVLAKGEVPEGLAEHFASVYAFGRWEGDDGVSELSTNPFMQGKVGITRRGTEFTIYTIAYDGTERRIDVPVAART